MTADNKSGSEFLFVPIISAVLLVLVVAGLVWVTQVRPSAAGQTETAAQAQAASQQQPAADTAPVSAGNPQMGQQKFASTCAACHGQNAEGIQGLGKPLADSQFIKNMSDEALIEFVKVGRGPSDPENTTGIAMPPKGGNPSLSDDDLQDIVAHLRALQ